MLKKMINAGIVLIVLIGIVAGFKTIKSNEYKSTMYMAIGDSLLIQKPSYGEIVFEGLKDKGIKSYNDIVKRSSLDTSSLLRFIEVKATIINGNTSENISSLIEKAKYITIQVGEVDINSNIRFNKIENKFYYNAEIIERIISNVQENIYNIVNAIHQINEKVDVYVVGYYFPYPSLNENEKAIGLELYGQLNAALRLGAYDSGATFVDISNLSNIDYLPNKENPLLNEEGQKELSNIILSAME